MEKKSTNLYHKCYPAQKVICRKLKITSCLQDFIYCWMQYHSPPVSHQLPGIFHHQIWYIIGYSISIIHQANFIIISFILSDTVSVSFTNCLSKPPLHISSSYLFYYWIQYQYHSPSVSHNLPCIFHHQIPKR